MPFSSYEMRAVPDPALGSMRPDGLTLSSHSCYDLQITYLANGFRGARGLKGAG
jgi:hypothetical protein